MAAIHIAVFLDHQQRAIEMRKLTAAGFIGVQQLHQGFRQPCGRLEAAVGQQGIDADMEPVDADTFHAAHHLQRTKGAPPFIPACARTLLFAEAAELQGGILKAAAQLLQHFLEGAGRQIVRLDQQLAGVYGGVFRQALDLP